MCLQSGVDVIRSHVCVGVRGRQSWCCCRKVLIQTTWEECVLALNGCHPLSVSNKGCSIIRLKEREGGGRLMSFGGNEFTSLSGRGETDGHVWYLEPSLCGSKGLYIVNYELYQLAYWSIECDSNVLYVKSYCKCKSWIAALFVDPLCHKCRTSGGSMLQEDSQFEWWTESSIDPRPTIWGWCSSSCHISQQHFHLRSPKHGADVNLSNPPWPFIGNPEAYQNSIYSLCWWNI